MVSFSLLGLQHPEPNGYRRATPTSTFQHRPGHPLKTYHQRYWSAQRNGTLEANRTKLGAWEFFKIVKVSDSKDKRINYGDKVGFYTHHKKWVMANKAGGSTMKASGKKRSKWETFALLAVPKPPKPGKAYQRGGETVYLSPSDTKKALVWLNQMVSAQQAPFCWRDSYGRGVGKPLSACRRGEQKNGLLCYPNCKKGYGGAGPVCWQNCKRGYKDLGAICTTPPRSYVRKTGPKTCPSGYTNMGLYCGKVFKTASLRCKKGYGVFLGKCRQHCKKGWRNMGITCAKGLNTYTKNSYGRGVGKPMICGRGLENDAALCYKKCKGGYNGVGPVCWGTCPKFQKVNCGAGCAKSKNQCALKVANMVLSAATVAINVATAGAGGAAAKTASAGVTKATKAGKVAAFKNGVVALAKAMKASKFATIATKGLKIYKASKGYIWLMKVLATNIPYIKHKDSLQSATLGNIRLAAVGASIVDPTGIIAVVNAYAHPICKKISPPKIVWLKE